VSLAQSNLASSSATPVAALSVDEDASSVIHSAHSEVFRELVVLIVRLLQHIDQTLSLIYDSHRTTTAENLSIKDAAHAMGISPTTIRRAVKNGELDAQNVGNGKRPTWRIKKVDLEAWARKEKGGGELEPPPTYCSEAGSSRHFKC